MKFKLETSGNFYPHPYDRYKLEKLGFQFEPSDYKDFVKDDSIKPEIEINTLEELKDFCQKYGDIVINETFDTIEIYDNTGRHI